jgi:phosphoserine phosphatase
MLLTVLVFASTLAYAAEPLPSWNDGPARDRILEFVRFVTDEKGPDFVEPGARIATFDNDGTLWLEYPLYTQMVFALDRVRELAPLHPEWATTQPFKAVLAGNLEKVAESGIEGLMEIIMATHAGMAAEEYEKIAATWLKSKKNDRFDRLYSELIYQPMIELLDYLRANEFKTFIVSGGGIAFMRPISETAYGIPPDQVVGSRIKTEYMVRDGKGVLVRKPEIGFIDDKAGKPVGIHEHIGRRPILAVGNSDGDFEMVEYTTSGEGRRLGVFIHHTDSEREYAYDRESKVGRLNRALDEADERGWLIVDMKDDWRVIWPGGE